MLFKIFYAISGRLLRKCNCCGMKLGPMLLAPSPIIPQLNNMYNAKLEPSIRRYNPSIRRWNGDADLPIIRDSP